MAGPPSPRPEFPPPAAVVMMPLGDTFRIRPFWKSAMKRFPEPSTATLEGKLRDAEVAGPPSPENPLLPLPATVAMMPLVDTFRIRWLSTMKRLPEPSTPTLPGLDNDDEIAGPPSPSNALVPLPATVVIVPLSDTFRIR